MLWIAVRNLWVYLVHTSNRANCAWCHASSWAGSRGTLVDHCCAIVQWLGWALLSPAVTCAPRPSVCQEAAARALSLCAGQALSFQQWRVALQALPRRPWGTGQQSPWEWLWVCIPTHVIQVGKRRHGAAEGSISLCIRILMGAASVDQATAPLSLLPPYGTHHSCHSPAFGAATQSFLSSPGHRFPGEAAPCWTKSAKGCGVGVGLQVQVPPAPSACPGAGAGVCRCVGHRLPLHGAGLRLSPHLAAILAASHSPVGCSWLGEGRAEVGRARAQLSWACRAGSSGRDRERAG